MTPTQFINNYWNDAVEVTKGTGIFPQTLIAQAILESAKGGKVPGSLLATKYNNYFGIKAGSKKIWKGGVVNLKTKEFTGTPNAVEIKDGFRVYDSPKDSFADYVKFLSTKRYKPVREATTPEAQAMALKKAGYATDANYSSKLTAIINTVNKFKRLAGKAIDVVGQNKGVSMGVVLAVAGTLYLLTSKKK